MDTAAALGIFRKIAPEFAEIADNEVRDRMVLYADMVSQKRFGPYYDRAIAYLTAHFLKLDQIAAEEGADSGTLTGHGLTMEKEGDLQRQYGSTVSSSAGSLDDLLSKSYYGRMFLAIRHMCIVPVITRMG